MMPSFMRGEITQAVRGVKNESSNSLPRAGVSRQFVPMNRNPVDVALQHVSETKHLLDALLTSSESFDYPTAKQALKALHKKSRELAKVRAELLEQAAAATPRNVLRLPAQPNPQPAVRV
jgi:hypothetical protein